MSSFKVIVEEKQMGRDMDIDGSSLPRNEKNTELIRKRKVFVPWFKFINLFLTAITQRVFERAKCDQICVFALCRNNRSQKRGAVSCWGLSPGGIQNLFQGKQRSPQIFPPGGMLKLPGHKPLTGGMLNKQHLQLLCPKELN